MVIKEKENKKGYSFALFLRGGQNRLNVNRLGNDIAHLPPRICIRLYEELVPFETENSAQLDGGYISSSHYGRGLLILEELS